MKRVMFAILFAVALNSGMLPLTHTAAEMVAPNPQVVSGDLLKIEGEVYTVHEMAGHEVRLHVDKTTKLEGMLRQVIRPRSFDDVSHPGDVFFAKLKVQVPPIEHIPYVLNKSGHLVGH
jgi:hypothetical protein